MLRKTTLLLVLLAAAPGGGARADGTAGTIRGRVVLAGEVPPQPALHVDHDTHLCGAKEPLVSEQLVRADDGALANVVVVLEGIAESGSAAGARASLRQQNCTFVPHVQSVTLGTTLAIGNGDPVLHNVHGFLAERTIFNLAMPVPGQVVERALAEPGLIRVQCDSGHGWMSAYIAVVPHRFHAVSGRDGTFTIADVPPGTYQLKAWHERLGELTQPVEVRAAEATQVAVTLRAKEEAAAPPAPDARRPKVTVDPLRDVVRETRSAVQELADIRQKDARERAVRDGQRLYARHCATCHGALGDGNGPSAANLDVAPRDFTKGSYKWRMTPAGAIPTLADLQRTIAVGVVGTPMPAWEGILEPGEIAILARYLTTFSDRFFIGEPPPPILQIPAEPPATPATLVQGKDLFTRMGCPACHGSQGHGDGPAAFALRDDWGHVVHPHDFRRYSAKGGPTGAAYYRAISTGLTGAPMPSFAAAMKPEERWALVQFLQSLREPRGPLDYVLDPAGRITPP